VTACVTALNASTACPSNGDRYLDLEQAEPLSEDQEQAALSARIPCLLNRAQCFLKLRPVNRESIILDCNAALDIATDTKDKVSVGVDVGVGMGVDG